MKVPGILNLRCFVVCICIILGYVSAFGQVPVHPKAGQISSALETFLAQEELKNGVVGFQLMDAKTGHIVLEHNAKLGLATASTLKTVISATAYHVMGSDFKFKTQLMYAGRIDQNGILHGDIIIKGSGDPTLGSDRFDETKEDLILTNWASAIQSAGIKHIQGRVIGDDLLFGGYQTPGGWPWRDMGNYYGAGVSALNWRENSFGVAFRPGKNEGDPASLETVSVKLPPFRLVNEVTTGKRGSGDEVFAYAGPYSGYYFLRGTHGLDLKKTIQFSTPDPAMDAAFQLKNKLDEHGILQDGSPTTTYRMKIEANQTLPGQATWVELQTHYSPSLDKIVHWFNRVSINLYGESLLKTLANLKNSTASPISTVEAARSVREFWHSKLGIDKAELEILDGSGLSPEIRVTANAMTAILASCRTEPWFASFYESLPTINGIKMKSGTISGVLGYAGYHEDKAGNAYTFTLLVSNYNGGARAMRNRMYKLLDVLK